VLPALSVTDRITSVVGSATTNIAIVTAEGISLEARDAIGNAAERKVGAQAVHQADELSDAGEYGKLPAWVDVVDGVVGGVGVAVALLRVGQVFDAVLLGEAAGGGVVPALAVLEEVGGAVVEAAGGAVGVEPGGGAGGGRGGRTGPRVAAATPGIS